MFKKILVILLAILLVMSMAACSCSNEGGGGDTGEMIKVDPLNLGDDFNSAYYPDKTQIKQRSGQVDVVIKFEGTEAAWQALASEYMRLHSGAVQVNIINTYEANYNERLQQEINDSKTTWDIVQGNLITNIEAHCYNMTSAVRSANGYTGGKIWRNVLNKEAYQTDSTQSSVYMINSQNLQTCWFINTVAFNSAQELATADGITLKQEPTTWEELLQVCEYMQKAGYSHPLGLSLDDDSINGFQFSWLLRIYGDYYYRNQYDFIMQDDTYRVDVTSTDPESQTGYGYQVSKLYNVILGEEDDSTRTTARIDYAKEGLNGPNYVGANSARYKEFIGQFEKIKNYLRTDAASTSFEDLRNKFMTQSDSKDSPQIMLDYAGSGLAFNEISGTFKMDFFDYPTMTSEGGFITEETIVRDVGGSGGYLSVLNHDAAQNELNLDFIKFVMTPYGQTIYYNALSKTDVAPKGITTVKNNLVIVPTKWAEFFKTTKIKFNGLSDNNEFVRNLIVSLNSDSDCVRLSIKNWRRLLVGDGGSFIDVNTFCSEWQTGLLNAWIKYSATKSWPTNLYKTWNKTV